MKRVLSLFCFFFVTGAPACGSSNPAGESCPDDLPASCPSPEPSYTTDIVPIIQGSCYPCHGPGGVEQQKFDYSTYAGVYAARSTILDQVYACLMPPVAGVADAGVEAGAPPLTTDARVKLLGWLVCGAPEN